MQKMASSLAGIASGMAMSNNAINPTANHRVFFHRRPQAAGYRRRWALACSVSEEQSLCAIMVQGGEYGTCRTYYY